MTDSDHGQRVAAPSGWQDWQRWVEGVDWSDWRSWLQRVASTDWASGAVAGDPMGTGAHPKATFRLPCEPSKRASRVRRSLST